jgi:hypothetical protein
MHIQYDMWYATLYTHVPTFRQKMHGYYTIKEACINIMHFLTKRQYIYSQV